jgi:hypothetical protein
VCDCLGFPVTNADTLLAYGHEQPIGVVPVVVFQNSIGHFTEADYGLNVVAV